MSNHFDMGLRVKDYGSHSPRRGVDNNAMKEAGWPPMQSEAWRRTSASCLPEQLPEYIN